MVNIDIFLLSQFLVSSLCTAPPLHRSLDCRISAYQILIVRVRAAEGTQTAFRPITSHIRDFFNLVVNSLET